MYVDIFGRMHYFPHYFSGCQKYYASRLRNGLNSWSWDVTAEEGLAGISPEEQ